MQMYDAIITIRSHGVPYNCDGIMLSCKMCQYYSSRVNSHFAGKRLTPTL